MLLGDRADLVEDTCGVVLAVSLLAIESHGSIAATAVTFASSRSAARAPAATALPASSGRWVAIKMRLYISLSKRTR